jgi:hypothetical protein
MAAVKPKARQTPAQLAAAAKILETATAAGVEAKHTLAVAKETAVKLLADAVAPTAALEHRLTLIEGQIQGLNDSVRSDSVESKERDSRMETLLKDTLEEARKTNGRVSKLEDRDEQRVMAKNDRQWLIPILVSVPTAVLSLTTLIFVWTHMG